MITKKQRKLAEEVEAELKIYNSSEYDSPETYFWGKLTLLLEDILGRELDR